MNPSSHKPKTCRDIQFLNEILNFNPKDRTKLTVWRYDFSILNQIVFKTSIFLVLAKLINLGLLDKLEFEYYYRL